MVLLPRAIRLTMAILALAGIAVLACPATAAVYHSRESALALAFGPEATVASQEIFLSQAEQATAGKLAGATIPSRLVQRYEGRRV